ncbi:MAG: hypothetical protein V9G08_06320 [Dermatophilaceae bacterium]
MSSGAAGNLATVALFTGLIDDAAVFPPGNSPLPVAVADHQDRHAEPFARYVGPLLVPAPAAVEAADLAGGRPIRLGLIVRPGSPLEPLGQALEALTGRDHLTVAGIEVGWSPTWTDLLEHSLPTTVEIPRVVFDAALDDVAAAYHRGARVQAKFRTGATPVWAWPGEAELAAFLVGCSERGMPFKLTGGLHHAVRAEHGTTAEPDPQHGLLNVVLAVRDALDGAEAEAVAARLGERDAAALAAATIALTTTDVAELRASFTAYGCCTVTDPIGELAELHVLDPTASQGD